MALDFDGVDPATEYLDRSSAPITVPPFTLSCWFTSDDISTEQYPVSIDDFSTLHTLGTIGHQGGTAGTLVAATSTDT